MKTYKHTWEEQKAQFQTNNFFLVKPFQNPFEVLKLSFEVGLKPLWCLAFKLHIVT
jgi:hypothetical protein